MDTNWLCDSGQIRPLGNFLRLEVTEKELAYIDGRRFFHSECLVPMKSEV